MPNTVTLDTKKRLTEIKPGERIIYYKGDFKKDIANSEGAGGVLLAEILEFAEQLKAEGKVYLVRKEVKKKTDHGPIHYYEYTAIGAV